MHQTQRPSGLTYMIITTFRKKFAQIIKLTINKISNNNYLLINIF